ncbi:hypothetical protein ACFCZ3_20350 [Cellulosimicrobium cellulans]|uniref:hypothetical protein n=1 Tax=Cellulosimicrobium cellulans TaxID=1710 RepID=UPI0035DF2891
MTDATQDDSDLIIEAPPFEQIPTDLWQGGPKAGACSPRAAVCYLALRNRGAERNFRITRKKLAAVQGVSVRTVDAALDELVEKGWLLITPTFRETGDKQQSSNRYTLLWTPIRDANDERLLRHQRQVEVFESDMDDRQKANLMRDEEDAARLGVTVAELRRSRKGKQRPDSTPVQDSAPGGNGQNDLTPSQFSARAPSQDSARGPSQDSAREEPHFSTQTSSTQTNSDDSVVGAREGQVEALLDVPGSVVTTIQVKRTLDDEFDEWYAAYPRKMARGAALKAFKAARKKVSFEVLTAGLAGYQNRVRGSEARFIAYPASWLNGERWADETDTETQARVGAPANGGFFAASEADRAANASMFDTDPWMDAPQAMASAPDPYAF